MRRYGLEVLRPELFDEELLYTDRIVEHDAWLPWQSFHRDRQFDFVGRLPSFAEVKVAAELMVVNGGEPSSGSIASSSRNKSKNGGPLQLAKKALMNLLICIVEKLYLSSITWR